MLIFIHIFKCNQSRIQPFTTFGQLVRGDDDRANSTGFIKVLASGPLVGPALIFAHGSIIKCGVSKNIVQSFRFGNMLAAFSNDHR